MPRYIAKSVKRSDIKLTIAQSPNLKTKIRSKAKLNVIL